MKVEVRVEPQEDLLVPKSRSSKEEQRRGLSAAAKMDFRDSVMVGGTLYKNPDMTHAEAVKLVVGRPGAFSTQPGGRTFVDQKTANLHKKKK